MSPGPLTDALSETLALFDGAGAPLSTTEAAERLDLGRRSTYERLERLADRGEIETKMAGGSARVWWRPRPESTKLLETERQYRSLVDALEEYAIFVLDPEGRVRTWNEGARRIKGYTAGEILGEHVSTFYAQEERAAGVPEDDLANAASTGSVESEGWRVRADGSTFRAHVTTTAIHDADSLLGFVTITHDLDERRDRVRPLRDERDLIGGILDVAPVSIGVVRPDGTIARANEYVEGHLERGGTSTEAYTVGEWDIYVEGAYVPVDDRPYMRVFETGEPVSGWECAVEFPGGERRWLSISAAPLHAGDEVERVVVCAENVTKLREQARQLERQRNAFASELEDVFDRIADGFYGLDGELRFTYVNDRAEELLGVDEGAVLGRDVRDVVSLTDDFEAAILEARDVGEPVFVEDYYEPLEGWFENTIYPSASGLSVYFRDVTERKERERELEEARRWNRTLVENYPAGAVGLVDEELRYVRFVGTPGGGTELTRTDYEGADVRDVLPERVAEVVVPPYEAALDGRSSEFEDAIDGRDYQFHFVPVSDDDGEVFAAIGMSQDVTERKERERELRDSEQRYRTLVDSFPDGAVALYDEECRYVAVGGQMYDRIDLSPEDAVGMTVGDRLSGEIVEALETTIERAFEGETEEVEAPYDGRDFRLQSLPIRDEDGEVILAMVVTQDVTERKAAEAALEGQREQLAALNNLNDTVRGITDAVIEQSTREEIEETVCALLAESGSYSFAWIGDVDARTQTVNLRAEAGIEGYLDDVTISVDPRDERSRGPTGRAVLEREMQVTQNVDAEPDHDPWRDHVNEHGFKSSAAIPIAHEDSLYGVLNVYATRPNAFSEDERAVIGQLGEVVGHAIAAIERQRALTSDEVVELDFQVNDLFGAIGVPVDPQGTITLGRAVPAGDGVFLEYGTATGEAIEAIEAVVEDPTVPMWKSLTVLRTDGETTHFELEMVDPPVLSTVTAEGGYFDVARIEDGDYYMRVHLPPSASVRRMVDAITAAYPAMELVTQRQVGRTRESAVSVRSTFQEVLTERQRAALEAGYYAGYFEWPREVKGEEVAESLGISPATYHQHLRSGQRKLLGAALDDQAPA